jgi:putative membrane protein
MAYRADACNQDLAHFQLLRRNWEEHMAAALFAFLHHIAAFTLAGAVVAEFVLVRDDITLKTARKLLTADLILGLSAAAVLAAGVLRVLFFEKGPTYYIHNLAFVAKMALFLTVGLLSIYPTKEFLSWRRPVKEGRQPVIEARKLSSIRAIIGWELIGIAAILLCAALMARGIG